MSKADGFLKTARIFEADDIRLINADCFDFLPTIPNDSINLFLIDPPYEVSRDTLVIQPLSAGMYLVEFTTNNVNIAPVFACRWISALGISVSRDWILSFGKLFAC